MGLDCSHDAFNGAYSAFYQLRREVARAAGCSYPPHNDPALDDNFVYFPDDTGKGIVEFLTHSDCDGEIEPKMCARIACELEELLPYIRDEEGSPHLARYGGYRGCVRRFIEGCRLAVAEGEPLEFL